MTGSRADWALLEFLVGMLRADKFFELDVWNVAGCDYSTIKNTMQFAPRPDLMLVLGDRHEIMMIVLAAHLVRLPIAHIAGGDVTEGSYDDAMRDAISRMACLHFVTSTSAMTRLTHMGYRNVHLVGNPAIDYMRGTIWHKERPINEPYVVVCYHPETLDGTNDIGKIFSSLPAGKQAVFVMPNDDRGSEDIRTAIQNYCVDRSGDARWCNSLPHSEYLNLLAHCDEFIGNSSALLYEAPELNINTRMIGKRQRGRVIPMGDGLACKRILKILKYTAGTL